MTDLSLLEVKNPNLITIVWACGHVVVFPRPAGVADPMPCPMPCLCISCHPEPVVHRDWVCPDCDYCFTFTFCIKRSDSTPGDVDTVVGTASP